MNPRLRHLFTGLLAVACLLGGYGLGVRSAALTAPPDASLSAADRAAFQVVWETLGQVERDYYRSDQLDSKKLATGAARGLVEAVGDPYTKLLDAQQADDVQAELRGRYAGIGATLEVRDGHLRVVSTLPGAPSDVLGLRSGDQVLSIDDAPTAGMSILEAARRLRGAAGTTVQVTFMHDGGSDPLEVAITRAEIRVPSVEGRLLDGSPSLGYVRISTFGEPTAQQLHEQLATLLDAGVRGIVLDVRGNPGGYLTSAVDVTSAFVRDGVVLYQQTGPAQTNERKAFRTNGSAQVPDVPLVVLVDGGSASAAEIVAAALRENQRALLVGQKTFGKGTVQEQHTLSDSSQFRVTVAQWLTPSGSAIQGQGLLPDVEVAPVEGRDAVLEAGVDVLGRSLAGGVAHG